MSKAIENLTERQLKFALIKLALSLTIMLVLGALIVSFFFQTDNKISNVPLYALLFAFGFGLLSQGFLTILHIIDWFEARRASKDLKRG